MKRQAAWAVSAVFLIFSAFIAGCTPRDADRTQEHPPSAFPGKTKTGGGK